MDQEEAAGHEDRPAEEAHGVRLGQWVVARRRELGITQEQLIARMDWRVDRNFVINLENGRRKRVPGQPYLGLLAEALGTTEHELLRQAGMLRGAPDAEERRRGRGRTAGEVRLAEALAGAADDELEALAGVVLGWRDSLRKAARRRGGGGGGAARLVAPARPALLRAGA